MVCAEVFVFCARTGHFINVTTQQWLTPEDTSRSVWWNILCIIIPSNVEFHNDAFLWITGSDNDGDVSNLTNWLPGPDDEDIFVSAYVGPAAMLPQPKNKHMQQSLFICSDAALTVASTLSFHTCTNAPLH